MDIRRRRTRDRLQTALRDLLADTPLEAIPVESLARRAGLTRQTFYAHFDGLPQMLDAYLGELLAEIETRHRELIEGAPEDEREARMQDFAASVFADLGRDDARVAALVRGVPGIDAEGRFAGLVETCLARGDPEGEARLSPAERRLHARYYTGAFFGLLRFWLTPGTDLDAAALARHFTQLSLHGRLCAAGRPD